MEDKTLFTDVEIETINRCNGKCPFCPVSQGNDKRAFAKMSEELFCKILDELGAMQYDKNLALFSSNEPFLDTRIIRFAQIAREKVPSAHIFLYTNGELLTEEKIRSIIPYLDKLVIDNYNDELKLNPNAVMADELCRQNEEWNQKIVIHLRKLNEVLFSRGGQAPNSQKRTTLNMPCIFPFKQLVIRPDGKVSLCCNDAYGKYTLGDCSKDSLKEIWYSEEYEKVRKAIRKGRKNVELCKYCDTL